MIRSTKQNPIGEKISRRRFLRVLGLGMAGMMIPKRVWANSVIENPNNAANDLLGRVTLSGIKLYDTPSSESMVLKTLPMDSLWEITGVTISKDEHSSNRVWYELDGMGYAHSGRIQPVRKQLNPTYQRIPKTGCLGEITVPYIDAYNRNRKDSQINYRFYYGATFWVLGKSDDSAGMCWYELFDDRYYRSYYVPGFAVRLVPRSELKPISAMVPPEEKQIIIDLPTQSLIAYEGDTPVFMSRISSGVYLREGGFTTPKGVYWTTRKRPCRHMANAPSAGYTGFDLPGVPWVSYFTSDGIALHGAYWHNDFGVPHSHGCVNLTPDAAKWIYRWTTPSVPPDVYHFTDKTGTRVIVQ